MYEYIYLINLEGRVRRKIRLRQCKMSSSKKKLTCKGILRQVLSVWGPESHYPPLTHCTVQYTRKQYTYSHMEGGGGRGELNQRKGERGDRGEHRSQSWVQNTNITERNWLSPVYKLWETPAAKSLSLRFSLHITFKNSIYRNLPRVSIENKETNPGFFSRFILSVWWWVWRLPCKLPHGHLGNISSK